MQEIRTALENLKRYVEGEQFKGYDPYDTLNSVMDFLHVGKWVPILAIQFQKRNPINIRPLLGIKNAHNAKAMGLFLQAYSTLFELSPGESVKSTMDFLFKWLCQNYSKGYRGYAWGYDFDWASPAKFVKAFTPSIVVTGFVARGVFKYYEVTGDRKALEVLRSACDFILNDLARWTTEDGMCFSYTPVAQDCCYNASMLGAELLARVYSITGEEELRSLATQALDFVVARQHEDGHWNYSLDPDTGKERRQIDFHQGFVLDSLLAFLECMPTLASQYQTALQKGAEFYRRQQFCDDGRAKRRIPQEWPADIHNQAQGIITFSKLRELDPGYLDFARTIALWTIKNLQDPTGYFYYQKHRFYTNKIPYMRWAQAWMMVALTTLLRELENKNENENYILSRTSCPLPSV